MPMRSGSEFGMHAASFQLQAALPMCMQKASGVREEFFWRHEV